MRAPRRSFSGGGVRGTEAATRTLRVPASVIVARYGKRGLSRVGPIGKHLIAVHPMLADDADKRARVRSVQRWNHEEPLGDQARGQHDVVDVSVLGPGTRFSLPGVEPASLDRGAEG